MLDGVLSLDCDLLLGLLSLLSDGVCDLGVFGLYPLLSCDLPLLFSNWTLLCVLFLL